MDANKSQKYIDLKKQTEENPK